MALWQRQVHDMFSFAEQFWRNFAFLSSSLNDDAILGYMYMYKQLLYVQILIRSCTIPSDVTVALCWNFISLPSETQCSTVANKISSILLYEVVFGEMSFFGEISFRDLFKWNEFWWTDFRWNDFFGEGKFRWNDIRGIFSMQWFWVKWFSVKCNAPGGLTWIE
jgi:hypothetical protein